MEKGFQVAFEAAWQAYVSGTIPIGACVLNEEDEVVAIGKNQIHCEADNKNLIAMHQLAHAEANALLQLSEEETPNRHPDIRKYTLYAVMEPCPFCFGAIVMGSIRNVKFAARDGIAGAMALNSSLEYIKSKNIRVEGPFINLEILQLAIQSCYELEYCSNPKRLIENWRTYCPMGISIGKRMHKDGILRQFASEGKPFEAVEEYITKYIS